MTGPHKTKRSKAEQARINGAKSRGPKTAHTKAVSSLNNLKHGRFAKDAIVLSTEDPAAYRAHLASYLRLLEPASPLEARLCRELAGIEWRLKRYLAVDNHLTDRQIAIATSSELAAGHQPSPLEVTSAGLEAYFTNSPVARILSQRENRLLRSRREIFHLLFEFRKKTKREYNPSEIIEDAELTPDPNPWFEPKTQQSPQPSESTELTPAEHTSAHEFEPKGEAVPEKE